MAIETNCLKSLADRVIRAGLRCEVTADSRLSVPGLAMDFLATDVKPAGAGISVVFEARAAGENREGIRVLATGLGSQLEESIQQAADQWAHGVLPVLVSYMLQPKDSAEVQVSPMIVGIPETGERFGWKVHLGPVIGRVYRRKDAIPRLDQRETDEALRTLDPLEAYQAVFNVLHGRAAHKSLFWVESFAARYPDGKVDATCRLKNNPWEEGTRALLIWAHGWPDTKGDLLSKRQFCLLEPTDVRALDSTGELSKTLDDNMPTTKRPWWKRLLGCDQEARRTHPKGSEEVES